MVPQPSVDPLKEPKHVSVTQAFKIIVRKIVMVITSEWYTSKVL